MSQSFVVYHQMKNNLMQTNGICRGSRYQPPLMVVRPIPDAQSPLSEENFEEHFNSLLLDIHSNNKSLPNEAGDDKNMNALEQALQDHLNKDKIDNRAENYEKYLLRIKNVK